MIKTQNPFALLSLLASLTAVGVTAVSPAHAQRTKPLVRPGTGAKPNIAPGARPQPGELLQVGRIYVTGTGDNRINVRIDKIDTAPSYHFIYAGNKNIQKISDPQKFTYLIVHLTVQNLSSKPRPIFNTDAGDKEIAPYLQMSIVRQYKNQYDGKDEAEYLEMDAQTYRREGDGLTLRLEGPKERYNIVAPGQTVKAFIGREVLRENDPPITQLQLNYFDSAVSEEQGTGRRVKGAAKASLMTFDVRGKAEKGEAPAPEATTGTTQAGRGAAVAWGNVAWGNVAWGNVAWGNVAWGNVAWGNVAWGNEETAGRRAEIGKTYRVGSGDKMLDVTVTRFETRDMEDGDAVRGDGEKIQQKLLLAYITVHNPTKKPLLAFSMTTKDDYWLQPALWRRNLHTTPPVYGFRADYFFTPDGKTDLTYVKDRDMSTNNAAIVQPGKTAQGLVRVEYTDVATMGPLAFFRLNYSPAFHAALDLTAAKRSGQPEDAKAIAANLLSYPLDTLPNATPLSKP